MNVDSDIYWSNLDNTFNGDHDSSWGEEGDSGFDLYAELFIGRITCDTLQDVSNWMTKSFYYADATDGDYLENAAFYGGDTTWQCEGDDFIDYSAIKGTDNWLGPSPGAHGKYPTWLGFQYGFETWNAINIGNEYNLSVKWTAEPPNPGWQGGSESAAVAGLKNAISNDHVTLLSGIAHANAQMSLDVGMSSWEANYHNTKPFFIHDYGCHCGDIDAPDGDGVLHSMLFHSDTELAFGCVYNTCYGWGSFSDTNSSSALQQKLFWDYFFDVVNNSGSAMNWQLGKAMAYSKDTMAPTVDWTYSRAPGSWRGIIQGCLLFGDPAQRLKSHDLEPPVTTLSFDGMPGENDWYLGRGNVTFNVTDNMQVETYYQVNNGEWKTYTDPFLISDEGKNLIRYYSVDAAGNEENIQSEYVKIDYTLPTVLLTKREISEDEIKFVAVITDEVSRPGWAEFYLDGILQFTDYESPYEWVWTGTGRHTVKAIGYDMAGNSAEDTMSTSYVQSSFISYSLNFYTNTFPRLFSVIDNIINR